MKREILVPLDGSELAESVLPHAVALARATSCDLVLIRVIEPPMWLTPMSYGRPYSQALAESWNGRFDIASEYLDSTAGSLRKRGVGARTEVLRGDPASAITSYAEECLGITAIAMSTHGRSGLKRWMLGSVAEKVLHASPRPLLLVRCPGAETEGSQATDAQGVEVKNYGTILVPLDGSPFAEQALEEAVAIAGGTDAKVQLLSVVPRPDARVVAEDGTVGEWLDEQIETETKCLDYYLTRLVERIAVHGLRVEKTCASGDPADEILRTSLSGVDLLVMATHGRSGWQRLWLGSVAMKVLQHATLPVLLVRVSKPLAGFAVDHDALQDITFEEKERSRFKEGTLHTANWFDTRR